MSYVSRIHYSVVWLVLSTVLKNQYPSTNYWGQNDHWSNRFWSGGRCAIFGVLILLLVASLLYQQIMNESENEPVTIFRHTGALFTDGVLLVHLVVDTDVLVRLSPYTGDVDLFAAVGDNRDILIKRLSEPHRSEMLRAKSVYRLNTSWNHLIGPTEPDDVYQLISHESTSVGVEEFVVRFHRSTDYLSTYRSQPILILVRPYPHATNKSEFLLEVFPHHFVYTTYDELRRGSDQIGPTYEQLIKQLAILPDLTEFEDRIKSSIGGAMDSPKLMKNTKVELPESRVKVLWMMVLDSLNALSPLFFAILEGIFDCLI
ncbi:hypothetical protein FGIG_10520 [Fasciola gigantica]|uniref:Uncharacterized protein n=1 Tax=Fasciola gigantica TaxID=46835 RepID=A0A504YCK4_FASGI|nr:hypothetical protein FGIG_10520 [Fasciola gigantica]